jgi:hypothetical protein
LISTSTTSSAGVVYQTPSGSTTDGGSVDATASFTVGTGEVTVVLTNLGENPTADSQLLNGLIFTVSGATAVTSTSGTGDISTISSGGSFTTGVSSSLNRWTTTDASHVLTLTALGGGQPNQLIIGPDNHGGFDPSTGSYTSAKSSITGKNPSVLGTATFVIDDAGITSASTISSVTFRFGTDADSNTVTGALEAVPEPASIVSGFIGLLCTVTFAASRSRRLRAA